MTLRTAVLRGHQYPHLGTRSLMGSFFSPTLRVLKKSFLEPKSPLDPCPLMRTIHSSWGRRWKGPLAPDTVVALTKERQTSEGRASLDQPPAVESQDGPILGHQPPAASQQTRPLIGWRA